MVDNLLFSLCIPQYNRTSFLLLSLERLQSQTVRNFEICISDGGSTDGRSSEIIQFLENSGMRYRYELQQKRAPYDRNLRAAIKLATGHYCFLLGNDDMLATNGTLKYIGDIVEAHLFPEVVVTNYYELSSTRDFRRVFRTGAMGQGIETAIANFRNYSFVSGVLLDRRLAQSYATPAWDGSEMYQTFLATRIVAGGGRLFGIVDNIILKDIQIEGEQVDSSARQARIHDVTIEERRLPLVELGRVVVDALSPFLPQESFDSAVKQVFRQLLLFTYPPWLVEYRRIQSWLYSIGIALGMRPRNILKGIPIKWSTRWYIRGLYAAVTLTGLFFPVRLFELLKPRLHTFAKRS